MTRASHPATPRQDLDARRNWTGPAIAGVLTPELVQFCQSGLSVIVGTRSVDGLPLAGLALSCMIGGEGSVRVLLREPANVELLRAVRAGAGIAATFTAPRTHRSIQLKASSARIAPVAEADLPATERQCANFRSELEFIGYSAELTFYYCTYRPDELAAIEFVPEEAYVQTPGPGAGSMLRR